MQWSTTLLMQRLVRTMHARTAFIQADSDWRRRGAGDVHAIGAARIALDVLHLLGIDVARLRPLQALERRVRHCHHLRHARGR